MKSIFSPAKVNLILSIHNKNVNGYHELTSLMAPLDFGDTIKITINNAKKDRLISNNPLIDVKENTIIKASKLVRDLFKHKYYFDFNLIKKIPIGSGYGGGSSNAISTIKGILKILKEDIKTSDFLIIANRIGSDCAFFIEEKPAIVTGSGNKVDILEHSIIKKLKGLEIILFKPNFSISTKNAYQSKEIKFENKEHAKNRITSFKDDTIHKNLFNSFESFAVNKYISINLILEKLRKNHIPSLISGSGSGCFSLIPNENKIINERFIIKIVKDLYGNNAFIKKTKII